MSSLARKFVRAIVAAILTIALPLMGVFVTILGTSAAQAQTAILRVDGDAGSAQGDGTGWGTDAFKYLQDAIAEADTLLSQPPQATNVQIWVASTDPSNPYRPDRSADKPDSTGARTATFLMRSDVAWYGGFAGSESALDEVNREVNPTVLSGPVDGR